MGEKSYLKDPPYMPKNKSGQEKHFLLYEAPFASYSQVKIEKSPKIWLRQEILVNSLCSLGLVRMNQLQISSKIIFSELVRENPWR